MRATPPETHGPPRAPGAWGGRLTAAFGLAGLLLALGWQQLSWSHWPAVVAFGLALLSGGAATIHRRELIELVWSPFHQPAGQPRRHRGAAAVLFGAGFVLAGLVLVAIGVASMAGLSHAIEATLARPFVPLFAMGLGLALAGSGMLVSRWTHFDAPTTAPWQRLPGRILGVWFLAMALVLLATGVVAVVQGDDWPTLFDRILRVGERFGNPTSASSPPSHLT